MLTLRAVGAALALLLVSAAGAPTALAQEPVKTFVLPAPTGAFGVGVYSQTVTDPARREIFTQNKADVRRLPVSVYYPTQKNACAPAPYLPAALGPAYSAEFGLVKGFDRVSFAHACPDAPIVPGDRRFPVVMFSHGLRHTQFSYRSIIEDLVSHGNIVVAIDHTHGAPLTHFPDGAPEKQDNSLWKRGEDPRQFRQVMMEYPRYWAEDTRRVLDLVTGAQPAPVQRGIHGRVDPGRIAYIGHSYGGMAAIYAGMFDMRLKGTVNLDGLIAGRYPLPVQADIPMLVLNAQDRNETATYMASARVLPVKEAHHMTFSDYVWMLENFDAKGRNIPKGADATGLGNIQLTREVLRLFLDCAFEQACQPLDRKLADIRAPLPAAAPGPVEAGGSAVAPKPGGAETGG